MDIIIRQKKIGLKIAENFLKTKQNIILLKTYGRILKANLSCTRKKVELE